ncbi:hypothetical protein KCU93_g428, partial [Aureobasidium melanogenum]
MPELANTRGWLSGVNPVQASRPGTGVGYLDEFGEMFLGVPPTRYSYRFTCIVKDLLRKACIFMHAVSMHEALLDR